jgi:hypothetical protein
MGTLFARAVTYLVFSISSLIICAVKEWYDQSSKNVSEKCEKHLIENEGLVTKSDDPRSVSAAYILHQHKQNFNKMIDEVKNKLSEHDLKIFEDLNNTSISVEYADPNKKKELDVEYSLKLK